MAAKLTRLTHEIAIQLNLLAENCTICSSRSRRQSGNFWLHPRSVTEAQSEGEARSYYGKTSFAFDWKFSCYINWNSMGHSKEGVSSCIQILRTDLSVILTIPFCPFSPLKQQCRIALHVGVEILPKRALNDFAYLICLDAQVLQITSGTGAVVNTHK
jgi:hypothetical protein